ncbi:MBOAT family O-acyltransferase [Clostridium sp. Marseille-QA1073]
MVFSSLIFIFLFLPLTIFIYYISPRALRNLILLLVSLVFYAWGEPLYILIMIFSTVFDYVNGLLIDKYRERKGIARAVFINSIVVNLGILCFFKYYGFVVDNINNIFNLSINAATLPLPVGISFYTFQTMSYAIDVYLDKVPVQKNIISFGAYVTMFPQLVAGPIVKYGDVAKQLDERKETLDKFGEGAELFIRGLSKKVLLANNIGLLWTTVKATPMAELTVISAWLGIIAFTFQIYFDFSGYSDMALGLGKMFGFDLMENFNYPYISKSVTEFWRRWHISLGSWFREYVYIPLGGNRTGQLKQLRNLFVVWFLTGLWHGANWNFILWGLYFGFFVTIEKLFLLKWLKNKPKFIGHIYTLIIVIVGWVFFEFESLSLAMGFIGTMFGFGKYLLMDSKTLYYISTNIVLFIVLAICSTPLPRKVIVSIRERLKMVGAIVVPPLYLILIFLSTAYLVNETYNPFLYFRF